jgi:hypothetical protein
MATWKVIALVSGNIEAASGPDPRPAGSTPMDRLARARRRQAEALKCAQKADPTVDLKWTCIR